MKLYTKKDRLLLLGTMLLGAVNAALSAFVSILLQKVIDIAAAGNLTGFIRLFAATLVYLAVLGLMSFLTAWLGKLLVKNVSQHLRNRIFNGILSRSPAQYQRQNTADYISALVNDVKLLEDNYLLPLLLCSEMIILFLTTLGILFYLNVAVTAVLLVSLVLMFLVPALFGKKLQSRQEAYSEQISRFTAESKDYFNGYEVIRGYSMLPRVLKRFAASNKKTAGKKFAADSLLAVNECLSDILSSLSIILIVFLAAYFLLKGQITTGTLMALVQLSGTFVTPVVMLMQNLPKISSMKPIKERLTSFAGSEPPAEMQTDLPEFRDSLVCRDLTFGYFPQQPIIEHLNLQLEAGGKYALEGRSGSGKTTLIKLLTGYSDDYQGEILLDGISLRQIPQSRINRLISVIHQNVFLFDTDIRDNICLGEEFTDRQLNQALADSGVSSFLPDLENGVHSPVGENGNNLSGGQKQRIAVARALIRSTPILIVDEGTSAVDRQTAFDIEKGLLTRKDLTVIVITHHMEEALLPYYNEVIRLKPAEG